MEKFLLIIILLIFMSLFFMHMLFVNSVNKEDDIKVSIVLPTMNTST